MHRDLRQFILLERNEDGTSYGSVFAWLGACYAMIEIRTPRALTNGSGAATAPLRGSHARSSIVDMHLGEPPLTQNSKHPLFCLTEVPLELTKELEFVERTWKEFAKYSRPCKKAERNSKKSRVLFKELKFLEKTWRNLQKSQLPAKKLEGIPKEGVLIFV